MEIIKKKICLEQFVSRVPSLLSCINENAENSWGEYPNTISIFNKNIRYGTFMNLYYSLLDVVINSIYYQYDKIGKKWILKDFDWREIYFNHNNVSYFNTLPENINQLTSNLNLNDKKIIGITSKEGAYIFNDVVNELTDYQYDGFYVLIKFNELLGRKITPLLYKCDKCDYVTFDSDICPLCNTKMSLTEQEVHVPYFIWLSDVEKQITFIESLKTQTNCCEKIKFEEYGGEHFLKYLYELKNEYNNHVKNIGIIPTIDIPLLLNSEITDLGLYTTYDVDSDNGNVVIGNTSNKKSNLVKTSAESKLRTLRRRIYSYDDNGIEMPGIFNKGYKYVLVSKINENGNIIPPIDSNESNTLTVNSIPDIKHHNPDIRFLKLNNGEYYSWDIIYDNKLEIPFKVGYIKNVEAYNNVYYGDTIYSINEKTKASVQNESYYESIKNVIDIYNKKLYSEGTLNDPIEGVNNVNETIVMGDINYDYDKIMSFYYNDVESKIKNIENILIEKLNKNYPQKLCYKQDYSFIYDLTYYIEGDPFILENGEINTNKIEKKLLFTNNGSVYVTFNETEIEFVYVIGGKLKENKNGVLELDEMSPFDITDENSWNGKGIWFKESFKLKKMCVNKYFIDGKDIDLMYDLIDFNTKEYTYTFEGIDFPREKYILCENVVYKSESYLNDVTNDFVFKDEKMNNLNFPLKEEYDVVIDRGCSAAFEKHLQLSEIKSWEDLENYRNGMYFNK